MWNFIINAVLWTLAFYGLFEIIKTIIYLYYFSKVKKEKSTYVVVPIKDYNENEDIEKNRNVEMAKEDNSDAGDTEVFLRSIIFKTLYENDNCVDEILVVDFGIKEETRNVIQRLENDYSCIRLVSSNKLERILEEN